jgi:hypothetical protein
LKNNRDNYNQIKALEVLESGFNEIKVKSIPVTTVVTFILCTLPLGDVTTPRLIGRDRRLIQLKRLRRSRTSLTRINSNFHQIPFIPTPNTIHPSKMAAGGEIGRDIDPPATRPISQIRRFTCRPETK